MYSLKASPDTSGFEILDGDEVIAAGLRLPVAAALVRALHTADVIRTTSNQVLVRVGEGRYEPYAFCNTKYAAERIRHALLLDTCDNVTPTDFQF